MCKGHDGLQIVSLRLYGTRVAKITDSIGSIQHPNTKQTVMRMLERKNRIINLIIVLGRTE